MAFKVSVITDELGPELSAGLRFAAEEGLDTVDIRSVGGVNFLSLEPSHQRAVAREIADTGLKVGCFATPLLKWSPPGKVAASAGDQFGFDAKGRSNAQLFDDAFAAAGRLGTRNLRIFSLLTYDGFRLDDLGADYALLIERAERYDMTLHIENEPVCNIATIGDLLGAMQMWRHPRLKALLDIGNADAAGVLPSPVELQALMPSVDLVHFKDATRARPRGRPMTDGDVAYADLVEPCLDGARDRELSLVIETHVPDLQPAATRRTLRAVRAMAARFAGA